MGRVLIHVQYLKGIGHLARTRLIAEAATRHGLDVHMVSGGLPLDDLRPVGATLHQLPALQAGPGGFKDLRDADGQAIDEAWRGRRREALLDLFADLEPDILMIETFPFGRRALSFELIPLLDAARARAAAPIIVSSIRDILQLKRRPERRAETVTLVRDHFDAVLVHGDPEFIPLEDTFPETSSIADRVRYTGLVAAPPTAFETEETTPRGEVLVSMGGGAIGSKLLWSALDVRQQGVLQDRPWRLLTGPHLPQDEFAALHEAAPEGVEIERFRSDFRRLLSAARLSISYAGYNTSVDVMRASVPAVFVTYGGDGGETEQSMRAARMAELGIGAIVRDDALTGESLAAAIETALSATPPTNKFDLNGAEASAAILASLRKPASGDSYL